MFVHLPSTIPQVHGKQVCSVVAQQAVAGSYPHKTAGVLKYIPDLVSVGMESDVVEAFVLILEAGIGERRCWDAAKKTDWQQ